MNDDAAPDDDPFVRQVDWLVHRAGGKDALVRATGNKVSARTLDNWTRGAYPRSSVTGAVRDLDAWASAQGFGYPEAAGAPRLVDSCGPGAPAGTAAPGSGPEAPRPRRSVPVLAAGAVGLVAVTAVVSVVTTLAVVGDPPVAVQEEATAMAALPTDGDGTTYPELTGSLGSNTFADPRTLADASVPIPPDTTVEVVCRYYSPVIPSVTPDGFWYLLAGEEWAGRWAPANTFMNGDVPGGPYTHNTDFAVPVCG